MTRRTLLFLAFGAGLAVAGTLSAAIVRNVEKTFPVSPGGLLKAATQGGDIIVKTADVPEVRVTARHKIRAATEKEADELLEKLTLTMDQTAEGVALEAKYEKQAGGFLNFGSWPPVQVDFLVTVPARYSAELKTSGGDIAVGSLEGRVKANTSGGDIALERIDGDVDASTSGGDITLREGTARAKVHTSGGDILIERAGGPTEANTSGGDIVIRSAAQLKRAHTSGGDIRAVLRGPLQEGCELSTSGGDVEVDVESGVAFELDASTSGGHVDAAGLTITIDKGGLRKSQLKGRVNGGGPLLRLRSSGGDIDIRTG